MHPLATLHRPPALDATVGERPAPSEVERVFVEPHGGRTRLVAWPAAVRVLELIGTEGHEWVRVTSLVGARWCQVLGDPLVGIYVEVGQGHGGRASAVAYTAIVGGASVLPARYGYWRAAVPAGTLHTVGEAIEIVRAWVCDAELPAGTEVRANIAG